MRVFVITSQARGFEAVAATRAKAEALMNDIHRELMFGGHRDGRVYIKETPVLQ